MKFCMTWFRRRYFLRFVERIAGRRDALIEGGGVVGFVAQIFAPLDDWRNAAWVKWGAAAAWAVYMSLVLALVDRPVEWDVKVATCLASLLVVESGLEILVRHLDRRK